MTVGVGLAWAVASWRWRDHRTLIIEWWEIVLFAVFWGRETVLNWNRPPRVGTTREMHRDAVAQAAASARTGRPTGMHLRNPGLRSTG